MRHAPFDRVIPVAIGEQRNTVPVDGSKLSNESHHAPGIIDCVAMRHKVVHAALRSGKPGNLGHRTAEDIRPPSHQALHRARGKPLGIDLGTGLRGDQGVLEGTDGAVTLGAGSNKICRTLLS